MSGVTVVDKRPTAADIIGKAASQAPSVTEPNPLDCQLVGPTSKRDLKVSGATQLTLSLGELTGEVTYLPGTDTRPAVIYAIPEMIREISKDCLLAQGCDPGQAEDQSLRALEAVYHGGNPKLDDAGIKAPCLIINAEVRNGAKIAHGLAHLRGGNELEAREAEEGYLRRNNVIPALPPLLIEDYPDPASHTRPIIEFSLGLGPVGGGGGYYRPPIRWVPPVQQPVKQPERAPAPAASKPVSPLVQKPTDSVQAASSGKNRRVDGAREESLPKKMSQLEEEQRTLLARAMAGLLGFFGITPAPQPPRTEPTEKGGAELSVGAATSSSFGSGATGGQSQQGQQGQGRKPKPPTNQRDQEQGK